MDYRPPEPREARLRQRMLALVASGPPALSRDHYDPGHFTASAFVLSPDGGRLLLILHDKLGLWLQPGGHVEPGDADLLAAARREVAEEVGIDQLTLAHEGIYDVDIHDIPPHRDAPAHEHFDLRFAFRARSEALVVGTEVRDARWWPLDALCDGLESDGSVRRAAMRLARPAAAHEATR
jgi:8-oxo-dGTP pyrophosphatase MutT (NUDIX family)